MKKFEYQVFPLVERSQDGIEDVLNREGKLGWRLVHLPPDRESFLIFEREAVIKNGEPRKRGGAVQV